MTDRARPAPDRGDAEPNELVVDQLVADVLALPLYRFLGLELVSSRPGAARVRLPITSASMGLGHFNGALSPLLLDIASFFAVLPMLDADEECATTDTSTSLLRPTFEGQTIDVEAEVVQRGRSRAFCRARATVDDRVVAYGHVTKAISRPDRQRWT